MRAVEEAALLLTVVMAQLIFSLPLDEDAPAWRRYEELEKQALRNTEQGCAFEPLADDVAMIGDVFDFYGVRNVTECEQICRHQRHFHCAAVLMRSSVCYLTGFKIRRDYWSTHYSKTCHMGPECFTAAGGWSSAHARIYPLPWPVLKANRNQQVLYCMALCARTPSCVGIDFKDNSRKCYLSDLLTIEENLGFQVYLRRC